LDSVVGCDVYGWHVQYSTVWRCSSTSRLVTAVQSVAGRGSSMTWPSTVDATSGDRCLHLVTSSTARTTTARSVSVRYVPTTRPQRTIKYLFTGLRAMPSTDRFTGLDGGVAIFYTAKGKIVCHKVLLILNHYHRLEIY